MTDLARILDYELNPHPAQSVQKVGEIAQDLQAGEPEKPEGYELFLALPQGVGFAGQSAIAVAGLLGSLRSELCH